MPFTPYKPQSNFTPYTGNNVSDVIQEHTVQVDKKQSLMDKLKSRVGNIVDIAKKPQDVTNTLLPERQIQAAGQIAGGINDVIGAGIDFVGNKIAENTPQSVKEPIKNAGVAILQSPIGQEGLKAIQGGIGSYNSWKQTNPRVAQDLEAVVNIASLLPIGKAGEIGVKTVKPLAKEALETTLERSSKKIVEKTSQKALDLTGKVLQGGTEDIAIGAKILSTLNTAAVKTYDDLSNVMRKSIKENLSKVDDAFSINKSKIKLKDFSQKVVEGKLKTSINYVDDALKQLDELYTKIKDPAEKLKIKALQAKAKIEGLTPSEVNKLARQYGSEFGEKAFSKKTGEALTSINAQAFENIRTGLKNTARSFLPDDVARNLDLEVSNMINVKKLIDKNKEGVNKLVQRIVPRGKVEKAFRAIAQGVDIATFGGPKAFITKLFFPSNVGQKTMNFIDLEEKLAKNLKFIQELNITPDETLPGKILNWLKSNKKTSLPIKSDPLIQEAKKYKTAEEFVKAQGISAYHGTPEKFTTFDLSKAGKSTDTGYRSAHQIRDAVDISSVDLSKLKEEVRSLDGYISNEKLNDFKKLQRMQVNPDAEIKIYRASPVNELNNGDWVTTNKSYANNIKQQNGGKVYEYIVKVNDLNLPKNIGDNPSGARFSAFQYNPKSQLTDIWNKANK